MRKLLAPCLCLVLISSGCASSPDVKEADVSDNRMTVSEEVEIGQKIHNQILSNFYTYSEPRTVEYVNQIGSSLARFAERSDLKYQFTLLYDDKIYATSAPGGFIYLTTGMVNFLDNEAQLAAVIAHELGQLQFKDARLSNGRKILDSVTQVGSTVAPAFGQFGALAVLGLMMLNMAADAANVSPDERLEKSDELAFHYLLAAGYDPQALLNFLNKLLDAPEDIVPYFYDYYQSRPITAARMLSAQKEFASLPLDGRTLETHYQPFLEKTKGIREIYKT